MYYNCSFFLWGNSGILIRKTLSLCELQKHKHMPKEFQGNNLASWFKLEASCMKRGRPHTSLFHDLCKEYTQGPPSDATPLKLGCLGQLAFKERCFFSSSSLFDASEIPIMQFFAACFAKWTKDTRESSRCSLNVKTWVHVALGLVFLVGTCNYHLFMFQDRKSLWGSFCLSQKILKLFSRQWCWI